MALMRICDRCGKDTKPRDLFATRNMFVGNIQYDLCDTCFNEYSKKSEKFNKEWFESGRVIANDKS